jgi:hypothetical protein
MRFSRLAVAFLASLPFVALGALPAGADSSTLRGWLSDEGCAGGRANSGVYTGTNPDCAKKCVAEGKKIVFVDPDHKRLLVIANQDVARKNIGDYVEVTGEVNSQAKTLQIATLKMLEKGRAMCDVPKKSK